MNLIENCRKLVGIDSTPGHGTLEIGRAAAQMCRDAGLTVELEEEEVNGISQCNVIARPPEGSREDELMLQAHLDTVDPGNFALWTKTQANPFNASIYGGVLYGLGVAKAKPDFLCKLEAVRRVLQSGRPVKRSFVLVGTFAGEVGMAGAIRLVRRKRIQARRALIGEPTDMRVAAGGQGVAVVEISIPFSQEEVEYREKHDLIESGSTQSRIFSARAQGATAADLNENAIVKMLDYLGHLPEGIAVMDLDGGANHNTVPSSAVLEIDLVGGFRDPIVPKLAALMRSVRQIEEELHEYEAKGYDPAHPTINIGMIRTYPDQVRIIGCCRLPPPVTDADYEGWMAKLAAACAEAGATFRIREYKGAFQTPEGASLVVTCQNILEEMGRPSALTRAAASTEANVFSRLGIECVVFGPGQSAGNSYAPNESIKLDDLERAIDFYQKVLERLCL